jgi:hypothetical protein
MAVLLYADDELVPTSSRSSRIDLAYHGSYLVNAVGNR